MGGCHTETHGGLFVSDPSPASVSVYVRECVSVRACVCAGASSPPLTATLSIRESKPTVLDHQLIERAIDRGRPPLRLQFQRLNGQVLSLVRLREETQEAIANFSQS